ncbi:Histone-lysine N-methyltransferase EZA1, partial [Bienertia sinuspersici]
MEMVFGSLFSQIRQMKEEIERNRLVQIQDLFCINDCRFFLKEKLDDNQRRLRSHIRWILSEKSVMNSSSVNSGSREAPLLRTERALCILNGFRPGSADKDIPNIHEVLFANSRIPEPEKIPKYTTWVFLRRCEFHTANQRMADDQSVVGRRRIYYDQFGNEALICSDSEDDVLRVEREKHDFSEGEDRILWRAFQEQGVNVDVADMASHFIGGTPVEIQERYNELKLKFEGPQEEGPSERNMSLEKSLSSVLDSIDNLFCRRCLSEKQLSLSEFEDRKPCGDQCHLLVGQTTEALVQGSNSLSLHQMDHNMIEGESSGSKSVSFEENVGSAAAAEGYTAGVLPASAVPIAQHENVAKRKIDGKNSVLDGSESLGNSIQNKSLKIQAIEPTTTVDETVSAGAISSAKIKKKSIEACQYMGSQVTCKHPLEVHTAKVINDFSSQRTANPQACEIVGGEVHGNNIRLELNQPTVSLGGQTISLSSSSEWKPLEKDLYLKGLEIFGRNRYTFCSCLIARNLLSGLKTCSEVSSYMCNNRASMAHEMNNANSSEGNARADINNTEQEIQMRSRPKIFRRRGRSRKFKYSSKSNGQPSSWKSIGDGEQSCKQYRPCDCKFMCGKDCSCLKKGTCCEKYCGCSKGCKNRFRGCHCAKSQCRSRQCPCFAANRECDPDVCRNCWVSILTIAFLICFSCGGGPLGEPPKKGDGQCGNMRLLLRQQQRILLGKSDVAGWGAFIKNSVNKHDYLGEYTGELISHREADKRGKMYDRANSSFLFDLNDEVTLILRPTVGALVARQIVHQFIEDSLFR